MKRLPFAGCGGLCWRRVPPTKSPSARWLCSWAVALDAIAVPAGNKVHFHGFGVGVQIYTWNGTSWGTAVPEAILFHANGVITIHFAGPTWQSNSGSTVVGALPPKAVTVDTNAIPWLRLDAKNPEGPGIFANTTFIQRVNTTGGKAPSANGTFVGQVARVPYTADYFFYRHTND